MNVFANPVSRGDDYLIFKFGQLQAAALLAQSEISAIPETARPAEEHDMIQFAIAGVERFARSLQLIQPSTRAGAAMKRRAAGWLAGGGLDCLLEPAEIAA